MAATNRVDILDPAILRPGRFDRKIAVGLPDVGGREAILQVHAKNKPLGDNVDLKQIAQTTAGFTGADLENLMNETPIYDIKPYLPYADSHPDAKGGFTDHIRDYRLQVEFPEELIKEIPTGQREALLEVLANDPRPRYQNRPDKVYGLAYGHKDIHFQVRDDILTVCDVTEFSSQKSFDKQNNV